MCIYIYFLRLLLIIHFMVYDLKYVLEVALCEFQVVTSSVLYHRQKKYILPLNVLFFILEKLASLCGMFTHLPPLYRYNLSDSIVSFI